MKLLYIIYIIVFLLIFFLGGQKIPDNLFGLNLSIVKTIITMVFDFIHKIEKGEGWIRTATTIYLFLSIPIAIRGLLIESKRIEAGKDISKEKEEDK